MWNEKTALMKNYRDLDQIERQEIEELREALEEGNQVEICLKSMYRYNNSWFLVGKYGESEIEIIVNENDWFPNLPSEPIQMSKGNPARISPKEWVRQQAIGSMGGTFSVILTEESDDPEEMCFYASRIMAMEEDRKETFFSGRTPEPEDHIMVRVISAMIRSVKVEAAGVECEIPRSEMSWIYTDNCRKAYPVGTVLEAVILKCETHPDEYGEDGTVDLELSVKSAKPHYDASWKYEVGDIALATVISQVDKGVVVDVAGETTCLITISPKFTRPELGQKLIVEITHVSENGRLSGIIKTRVPMREVRELDEKEKTLRQKAEKAYLKWLNFNRCVPTDLARDYLINYYWSQYDGVVDQKKLKEWQLAADRILVSLHIQGIRDEGDGCFHTPREFANLLEDPKPDRLMRLSQLYQIYTEKMDPGCKFAIPTEMSEVEVLTLLESDGELKSIAVAPDGDTEEIQSWIRDLTGKAFENLDETVPEDDPLFWKKIRAMKNARGMDQVILAEDNAAIEKIRELPEGRELLDNSEVWIHANERLTVPWEGIESLLDEDLKAAS